MTVRTAKDSLEIKTDAHTTPEALVTAQKQARAIKNACAVDNASADIMYTLPKLMLAGGGIGGAGGAIVGGVVGAGIGAGPGAAAGIPLGAMTGATVALGKAGWDFVADKVNPKVDMSCVRQHLSETTVQTDARLVIPNAPGGVRIR